MSPALPVPDLPQKAAHAAEERASLEAFLDFQRGVLLRKVGGLPEEDLRRTMTDSGLSLLGMLKHLALVERYWFRRVFAGEDVSTVWSDDDPDADWRVEDGETPERIAALYREEVERARAIVSEAALDDLARGEAADVSLRWIMLHMIEEVARHLGHADIIRERLDGAVGD